MKELKPFETFLLNLEDAERRMLNEFAQLHRNDISYFERYLIWRKKRRFIKVLRWIQKRHEEGKRHLKTRSRDTG